MHAMSLFINGWILASKMHATPKITGFNLSYFYLSFYNTIKYKEIIKWVRSGSQPSLVCGSVGLVGQQVWPTSNAAVSLVLYASTIYQTGWIISITQISCKCNSINSIIHVVFVMFFSLSFFPALALFYNIICLRFQSQFCSMHIV